MENTTISTVAVTAGSAESLKTEIREGLHPSEERECNKFLYLGVEVMAEGLHPRGDITPVTSVFMRPSWHDKVLSAGRQRTDDIYRLQGDTWQTKIGQGKIKLVNRLGDLQVEHEKCIMQTMKINGGLYDRNDELVDMREKSTADTRDFLRKNSLRQWKIDPKQTKLEDVDSDVLAQILAMGEMWSFMSTLIDEQLSDFLAVAAWIKKHGQSGKVYATGLGTSQGLKVTEADA